MAEFTIENVEQILSDHGITDEDTVAELRDIWSLTYRANRNWQKTYDMASIPGWIEATFGTGGSGDGTEALEGTEDTASGGTEAAASGGTQSVAYAYSGTEPPTAAVPQYYTSGDTVVFYGESGGVEASWPADHLVDEVTYAVLEFGKRLQSAALKGITDGTASGGGESVSGDGLSTGSGDGIIIDGTASGDGTGVSGDSTTTTTEEVSENG